MFATVAFPISSYKQFTYRIPNGLREAVKVGVRVRAPFGNRIITGIVVSTSQNTDYKGSLKQIRELVDNQQIMDSHLWKLVCWMSEYYFTPVGQVAKTVLPSRLSTKYQPPTISLVAFKSFGENKDQMKKRAPAQANVLEYLSGIKGAVPVANLNNLVSSPSAICRILHEKDLVDLDIVTSLPDVTGFTFSPIHKDITFTKEQQSVINILLNGLTSNVFTPFLLHGVTGSGKTEIYIELVQQALKKGKTAILLLPEIALTPQIAGRFRAVFGDEIALWHSKLSQAARSWTWKQICRGKFRVVIGARSAIFTPLKNLGAIIIDEEQEHSYKQESPAPRYHARDVALMRGKIHNAVVVMASATPSLESYYNHIQGKYSYLRIKERYGKIPYPYVHVVDILKEQEETGKFQNVISSTLQNKMEEKLSIGDQIILLQNRRGFAPILRCEDCAHVESCKQCEITLTYHSHGNVLKCHYCGYETHDIVTMCSACSSPNIKLMGIGTQKVEETVSSIFPGVTVERLDMDIAHSSKSVTKILESFDSGEIQILIGTQMIAKGLDFDKATLVGIINGDTGLFLPDFRSGEKVFQLIYQAAGRSGRRKPGEVVIQTYNPENTVLKYAARLDQKTYYNIALSERQELNYPPFSWMIRIEFSGKSRKAVEKTAISVREKLRNPFKGLEILGPAFCYRERIRNRYRMHIVMKSNKNKDQNGNKLHKFLNKHFDSGLLKKSKGDIKIAIDVNPVSML